MNYMKKNKRLTYRLNKKVKKSTMRKCDSFCKNDYMAEMDKIHQKTMDLYKKNPIMEPPREFTKEDRELFYHMCKKNHCNQQCVGYTKPPEFYKKIKNGFQKSNPKRIQQLKKKGALSECEDPNAF